MVVSGMLGLPFLWLNTEQEASMAQPAAQPKSDERTGAPLSRRTKIRSKTDV
jgi:hypothetical protein